MLLKLGLPKGSLQESTFALFAKAGFRLSVDERSYYPGIDDPEISPMLLRSQEMSRYVEDGALDAGICGRDWVVENDSDVHEVCKLVYSKQQRVPVRWVIAVPAASSIQSPRDLAGKRIATELVNFTRRYFKKLGVPVDVEFSWGATEVKVPNLVDAIVDVTETGSSLRANNLRIVETILESYTVLIANHDAWKDEERRRKLENLAMLLSAALEAHEKVGLKMNVKREHVPDVVRLLPALSSPTVSPLYGSKVLLDYSGELPMPDEMALEVVIDERKVKELLPELKRAGATGIIEYPLNKVIY
ncbi:ATP phosphoribosyltransferase [bacterium]|nr:ATP phosphoribosyltransferase [bacterium]